MTREEMVADRYRRKMESGRPEICNCGCHRHRGMMHCVPCCHTCRFCDQRIRASCYPGHKLHCEASTRSAVTLFVLAGENNVDRFPGHLTRARRGWWYPDLFDFLTFRASTA